MKKVAAAGLVGFALMAAASVFKEHKSVDTGNNDSADPAPKTMMADTATTNSVPAKNFKMV